MSEEKRNDAQSDKGAGNDKGSKPASKPSTAGGARKSATPSQPAGSAQAKKPAASKTAAQTAPKASEPAQPTVDKSAAKSTASSASSTAPAKASAPTPESATSTTAGASSAKPTPASANTSASRTDKSGTSPSPTRAGGASGGVPPTGGHGNGRDRKSGGPALLVAIIALIVAIVAIIGAGWLWYRGEQKLASLDSRTDTVEQGMQSSVQKVVMPRLSKFDQRLESMSSNVTSSRDKQAKALSSMQESLKSVQARTAAMADQIDGNANRWELNQIESLLRAGNQRLQLFDDPQGARQALQLANEAIGRKGDPRLFNIRSEIVNEIAALRALPSPDIEGLSLSLAAMIKQVPGLPLASTVPGEYTQGGGGSQSGDGSNGDAAGAAGSDQDNAGDDGFSVDAFKSQFTQGWGHFKNSVSQALSGMLTIRREDGTQSALLPPDQVFFLNQNLQLELRTARLALLEQDTEAYRESLASAKQWLGDYYDTDASAVSSMSDQLDQMSNVKLDWDAPDISKSLSMLRDVMAQRAGGNGGGGGSTAGNGGSENANASGDNAAANTASDDSQSGTDAGQDGQ